MQSNDVCILFYDTRKGNTQAYDALVLDTALLRDGHAHAKRLASELGILLSSIDGCAGDEEQESKEERKTLNDLAQEIHHTAREHGWWDEPCSFGEIIALCHSELSEALEAYRNDEEVMFLKDGKPEGIAVELIDCVIRIFDYLYERGIDIDSILRMKMKYNETRPYRHGGKKL